DEDGMRVAKRTDDEVAIGIELEADAHGDVHPFVDQVDAPVCGQYQQFYLWKFFHEARQDRRHEVLRERHRATHAHEPTWLGGQLRDGLLRCLRLGHHRLAVA